MRYHSFAAMLHSSPKASANWPYHQARKRQGKEVGGNSGDRCENIKKLKDKGGLE
jgi:hypothetical protein